MCKTDLAWDSTFLFCSLMLWEMGFWRDMFKDNLIAGAVPFTFIINNLPHKNES